MNSPPAKSRTIPAIATAGLGLAIHFLIAFTAASVFYMGSRQFSFLTRHAVRSGLLYGIAVYVFMYWLVGRSRSLTHAIPFRET